MNYWLVKSEPETFSWDLFVSKNGDHWDGVRNYQARNNLKLMKKEDLVLFYHSGDGKEVVGLAKVKTEFYQDPTTEDPNWVAVDLIPVRKLNKAVTLSTIKSTPELSNVPLIRHTRLSVMPLDEKDFSLILKMSD
ncbi:MAG: EVE domain-containing protein [Saprospiraceae bacterium]|nr:EVE domain-containing protein [Saprospiraceae bacterium]